MYILHCRIATDFYAVIKEKVKDRGRQIWQGKDQKLKEIKEYVDSYKVKSRLSGQKQVVINRLMLGHTPNTWIPYGQCGA